MARGLTVRENTLALAAELRFWLDTERDAKSGDDHQYTRERIRMARTELSSAVLADLKPEALFKTALERNLTPEQVAEIGKPQAASPCPLNAFASPVATVPCSKDAGHDGPCMGELGAMHDATRKTREGRP
jgi:hypothetical protein